MMNKEEIIIDGVDVSGCKNYSCGICEEENKIPRTINHFTANCKLYPNCYYKQLKRTQQEIEKYSAINEQETKDYAELKKENDQLKEVVAKRLIEKGVFINTIDKLRKIIDEKLEKENKLTNALQDIKNLVTKHYLQNKRQLVQNYDCLDNFMQKIEEKCNEVNQ